MGRQHIATLVHQFPYHIFLLFEYIPTTDYNHIRLCMLPVLYYLLLYRSIYLSTYFAGPDYAKLCNVMAIHIMKIIKSKNIRFDLISLFKCI